MRHSNAPSDANLMDSLVATDDGWRLVESGWDRDRAVAVGSNFLVGNGYLGYRGTSPEQGADDYVALVVTDTYDCADGHWTELTTAPNPLRVSARVEGVPIAVVSADAVEMSLDLRAGEYRSQFQARVDDAAVAVQVERFASYDQLHLLGQRWTFTSDRDVAIEIDVGVDGAIWSLNGEHLPSLDLVVDDDVIGAAGTTCESHVELAVAAATTLGDGVRAAREVMTEGRSMWHRYRLDVAAGTSVTAETVAAVVSSNDVEAPADRAREIVQSARLAGYADLLAASRRQWDRTWEAMDVVIDGNVADQAALRFSAYHNRICTPAHTDHLPVGARGLSCQAYQGSAFWDQEIYNLPAFLFTAPEIARSLLVYRHGTLDGARRKAARLGYDGAYYAWISGLTGDELCPDIFFSDVLTGRPIRNHFNVWQMHISPDIVTTIAHYVEVTGDVDFLVDHGAEIAFEVARFLRSFVRYDDWKGTYHCIRLLGPDEWHENVDDNAFTNYQTHAALTFAIDTYEQLGITHPEARQGLADRLSLTADEVDAWRRVRDQLFLPEPDEHSMLIEQFAGFYELEDVTPAEVRTRLLDPGEYWGWPNGVAVHTQVSKQADVAMLLWLHDERLDDQTIRANYDYYEPRCSHNSSLSHAAHGMVAARIGLIDEALAHFRATATVDLLNTNHPVVGGTFIGGIHTAACGGTYQLAVQGFGGLGFANGRLRIDPVLPIEWEALTYPVRWRGHRLQVTASPDSVTITADSANDASVSLSVGDTEVQVSPGETVDVAAFDQ